MSTDYGYTLIVEPLGSPRATNGSQQRLKGDQNSLCSELTHYQFCVFDTAYYVEALPAVEDPKGSTKSVYIHNLYSLVVFHP